MKDLGTWDLGTRRDTARFTFYGVRAVPVAGGAPAAGVGRATPVPQGQVPVRAPASRPAGFTQGV